MYITWHGQTCFKITTKNEDKDVSLITNPHSLESGLKLPRLHADMVTLAHTDAAAFDINAINGTASTDEPFVITSPGEYEIKGIFITGVQGYKDSSEGSELGSNVLYRFDIEGVAVGFLGDCGQNKLTASQIEGLGTIDVLLIPVGGGDSLNSEMAVKIISQIEPRMIIPMRYDLPGVKTPLDSIEKFAKEMGIAAVETVSKIRITKKDLPQADAEVVFLNLS